MQQCLPQNRKLRIRAIKQPIKDLQSDISDCVLHDLKKEYLHHVHWIIPKYQHVHHYALTGAVKM